MRGIILSYVAESDTGVIAAENGRQYRFDGDAWMDGSAPATGLKVQFSPREEQALEIYLAAAAPVASEAPPHPQSIAALICGVLAIVGGFFCGCCCLLAIPAVICGHLGLKSAKREDSPTGKGLALAGLIIGYLILALLLVIIVVVLVAIAADQDLEKFKFPGIPGAE
ncbi:MAG: hypothetical protein RL095_777 [Verrucomicrobiota bacterium]|jgi:hypothetical protein